MFDPVDPKQSFPSLEQGILSYWKIENLFQRSKERRKGGETFSFYDGPPFATGLPHYGHLLAGTIKDVIPRYQTMRGNYVERRFGWDCHGLPIENLIEKEQNIKNKQEIEAIGVAKFNELCRGSVQRYVKEWRATVERSGRWVDMDWDYRTMDAEYMESIWWVFKQLWDKNLIYEGYKPMHVCPRCVTPLSNFEVTTGYKDITDSSATAKFRLKKEDNDDKDVNETYVLAWTTTPWTLPGNVFLAVNPAVRYYKFQIPDDDSESWYIACEEFVRKRADEFGHRIEDGADYPSNKSQIFPDWGHPLRGADLVGMKYEPLFPYFANEYNESGFRIVEGDFVTTEDGTGIVHIAPGFGEDDFHIGQREGIPLLQHVSMDGHFVPAVTDFAGEEVKPKDDPAKMDRKIAQWLEKHGKLFSTESYTHSYPHCWRCDSPLLNYATSSWFVAVEKVKDNMLNNAAKVEWMPAHLKEGRFGKWLAGAKDWTISRNRYWGTPLPVWRNEDDTDVVASRDELMTHCPWRFTKISVTHGGKEKPTTKEPLSVYLQKTLPLHRSEHLLIHTDEQGMRDAKHFFTREDPEKIARQPLPAAGAPVSYFWDHEREETLDLHKHIVDDLIWWGNTKGVATLTIARHGQTDWNAEDKVQGAKKDISLNAKGRTQAEEAAKNLKKEQFDVLVCSDLDRAVETAEIFSKAIGLPITEKSHLFHERDFGEWNGKSGDDLRKESSFSDEYDLSFHTSTGEGGETLSQFFKRVKEGYEYLLKKYEGKRVLLVTHGGVLRALHTMHEQLSYEEGAKLTIENCATYEMPLGAVLRRTPEVLDCWFESGSMPYAQNHFPFEADSGALPPGFPANFIAEGVDQTRLWFYTLMVLSTILFDDTSYKHVVVNGIVLAEDGRKMSKKLKNYPDPNEVIDRHGADALRFTLMKSPAVRAEDLRFSERAVEETVRSVLLPLWNSYSFFVTYANDAKFEPVATHTHSTHPLDVYLRALVQDLANRMTMQLEAYDLSATCKELEETIDALTNWYIRLSRRRFAGKDVSAEERHAALVTLHEALVTVTQLLAPFCPFIADAMYLNLVPEEHGSVHLTDWPLTRPLSAQEQSLLHRHDVLRLIVSLGMKVRAEGKIKTRQPLVKAIVAIPQALLPREALLEEDIALLAAELNVKEITLSDDPGSLGSKILKIDARKVGPRLGGRVQELIAAGKRGEFEVKDDGSMLVLDETIAPDEGTIVYQGSEGANIQSERGIVVSLDTTVSKELEHEGAARDLIRAIQKFRKDNGFAVGDQITIEIHGADELLETHGDLIAQETNSTFGPSSLSLTFHG